jgi:hypothetical protein
MTEADDVSDSIEIRDPAIDSEAVMRLIRENIRLRRAQAEAQGLNYEAFVEGLYAANPAARFSHTLYYDLRRMSVSYDKIGVGLSLTETRLPLIGPLVQRVRAGLHQLVLYYVNMLAGQQVRYNEYSLRALSTLVKELEVGPTSSELDALRKEVAQLRAHISAMEAGAGKTQL